MGFLATFFYSQFFVTLPIPTKPFTGQTIIVTGSNTGLGLEAAKHFVRLYASHVILAVRTTSKGLAAKQTIQEQYPPAQYPTKISVWPLDLSSFASIQAFAKQVESLDRIDVLLENAGIMTKYWTVEEGMEKHIQVNVLGTEMLALLCLPKLQETSRKFNVKPRLCIVGSELYEIAKFSERSAEDIFEELNREENWGKSAGDRYAVSKALQTFFVRELAERIDKSSKPKVIVNILNPGACYSDFDRESTGLGRAVITFLKFIIARTTEEGARTLVAAAEAGEETHGQYMTNCKISSVSSLVTSAEGVALQKKLWVQTLKRLEDVQPGLEGNI